MAAGIAPIFYASVHNEAPHTDGDGGAAGAFKTQNLNLDGTGTLFTIFTGAANGSGMDYALIRSAGTSVATVMRFFYFDGTNSNLIDEISINSSTAATATALAPIIWTPPKVIARIQSGHKFKATLGTTVVAGFFVTTFGGDF